jgi:hypothetical protein
MSWYGILGKRSQRGEKDEEGKEDVFHDNWGIMDQWIVGLKDYRIIGLQDFGLVLAKIRKKSFANFLICAFANFLYLCKLI